MADAIQKAAPAKVTPYNQVKQLLEANAESIKQRLPKHLTPDRMLKVSLAIIHKTPALQECGVSSLVQCVLDAAEIGLEPGSALGHCYLVPYRRTDKNSNKSWMEAQLQIGYRGFIELALRSARVVDIDADIIHENDTWQVERGTDSKLKHIPNLAKPGGMVAAYAVATLANSVKKFAIMSKAQVDAIRGRSKAGQFGPWVTDYEEMAKKTAIRRLCKLVSLSPELARAVEVDEQDFVDVAEVEVTPSTRTEELKAKLAGKTPKPPLLIDVKANETEAQALDRATTETTPPDDSEVPTGEPPPEYQLPGQEAQQS